MLRPLQHMPPERCLEDARLKKAKLVSKLEEDARRKEEREQQRKSGGAGTAAQQVSSSWTFQLFNILWLVGLLVSGVVDWMVMA
jgi:hypothetical protein